MQGDADDLTCQQVICAFDSHGEANDEQKDTHTDIDHRVLHLLGYVDEPVGKIFNRLLL